jgi:hypothetical protein
MSEEEIRLDQTKKVFDVLAKLISENESCTYRYLIYDLLGFKKENYEELLGGLAIANVLVEREIMHYIIENVRKYANEITKKYWSDDGRAIIAEKVLEILGKEVN